MRFIKFLYLIRALCQFGAYYLTKGLLFHKDDHVIYVSELMSSGSDDDIGIFMVGLISLITGMVLIFISSKKWISTIVTLSTVLQFFLGYLLIEVGSVFETMIYGVNLFLIIGFIIHIIIWGYVIYWWQEKILVDQ